MTFTPPRLARSLLVWRIPAADRDEVIGDLDEQFLEVAEAEGLGKARAWYRRHALRLAWTLGGRQTPTLSCVVVRARVAGDEFRYAARRLRAQPTASAASIVTLALALGATVATWSILSAVLLHPLPTVRTNGLMTVGSRSLDAPPTAPSAYGRHTHLAFRSMRQSGVFADAAAVGRWPADLRVGDVSSSMGIGFVTPNFFDVLGVRVSPGRGLLSDDGAAGAPAVAVVSHLFWRRALSSDPAAIGRHIAIGGHAVTIVGIAPEGFVGLSLSSEPVNLYVPIQTVSTLTGNRANWLAEPGRQAEPPAWLQVVGTLTGTTTPAQAATRLGEFVPAAVQRMSVGERTESTRYTVVDLESTAVAGSGALTQFARMLGVTVGLLLFSGCLTVGMLVLLRTEGRRDEFALCLALGGSRARLAGGVLAESALLSAASAVAAVPISAWLVDGVRAFGLPGRIRIEWLHLTLDWRALGVAAAAAVVATVLMALVASVFGLSANVADALRARAGVTPRVGRHRTRAALAATQVAVALVLLAGAGLMARSLSRALQLNADTDIAHVADATVSTTTAKYTPERAWAFFADVSQRLSRDSRIKAVSISQFRGGGTTLTVDGGDRRMPRTFRHHVVDEDYFRVFGLVPVEGRAFTAHDRQTNAPVAIVSQSLARAIGEGGSPLGRRLRFGMGPGVEPEDFEIVGVIPDVIQSVESLEPLVVYRPLTERDGTLTSAAVTLLVDGEATTVTRDVQATLRALDSAVTVPEFLTIEQKLRRQMEAQAFGLTVLGALGALATVLTLFGMYVLTEALAAARRREMGVRAALGATRSELCGLVLGQTLRPVIIGMAAGLVLVYLGSGLVRALLYRVDPLDVPTIGGVAVLLVALGAAVTVRPALRAAHVDLAQLLKE